MNESTQKMYCPSCGETVDTFVMLDTDMVEKHHCFVCGAEVSGRAPAAVKALEMMLVAEDSMVFREVLQDKVVERGIARQVEMADNGEEFLAMFTRRLAHGLPVSLAVLDIRMPGMNGVNAAMAMRAVEKGLGMKRPVPILFFSSVKCDDTLKELFKRCSPARYINKGASPSPENLADRLVEVIQRLLTESTVKK
ncbi:MAG TPA: response regulator [bacterium]|nr:response regulator [bacterium]